LLIINKYLELKTILHTAKYFGVFESNIKKILINNNIPIIFGGVHPQLEEILERYKQNVPLKQIALEFKIPKHMVKEYVKKAGIGIGWERSTFLKRNNLPLESVLKIYDDFGTLAETARHFNTTVSTLRKIISPHRQTNWQLEVQKKVLDNKDFIIEHYNKGWSGKEIANKIGVCHDIIFKYFEEFGLAPREICGFNTSIERQVLQILEELEVKYKHQYHVQIGPTKRDRRIYDFILPDHNLIIEVNGDYWHGNSDKFTELNDIQIKTQKRDAEKYELAISLGHRIIYIWERELKTDVEKVKNKIKNEINL